MSWVIENADNILNLVIAVVSLVLTIPAVKGLGASANAKLNDLHLSKAKEFALSCVTEVYQEYVRPLKASGKWDDDAKKEAFARARELLWLRIKSEGLSVAQDSIPGLIEVAVQYLKTKGVLAKASPFGGVVSQALDSVSRSAPSIPGQPELP